MNTPYHSVFLTKDPEADNPHETRFVDLYFECLAATCAKARRGVYRWKIVEEGLSDLAEVFSCHAFAFIPQKSPPTFILALNPNPDELDQLYDYWSARVRDRMESGDTMAHIITPKYNPQPARTI